MSQNENGTPVQGKGLAITGFVLSLVTLIFASGTAVLAAATIATGGSGWLMYLWLVVTILSVLLSVLGMVKLGKTGGKKGLAIAGMIIGIVSTIYTIILIIGLNAAATFSNKYMEGVNGEKSQFEQELDKAFEEAAKQYEQEFEEIEE